MVVQQGLKDAMVFSVDNFKYPLVSCEFAQRCRCLGSQAGNHVGDVLSHTCYPRCVRIYISLCHKCLCDFFSILFAELSLQTSQREDHVYLVHSCILSNQHWLMAGLQ